MSSPLNKTPESLNAGLRRKDSKNALTTCRGVTGGGRACRRPIAGSKAANGLRGASSTGAMVIPQATGDPALFFCWQHKDQAQLPQFGGSEVVEVDGRTSLEDAFNRLGLDEVEEEGEDSSLEPIPVPSPRDRAGYDAIPRLPSPERFVGPSKQPVTGDVTRTANGLRRPSDSGRYRQRDPRYYSNHKRNHSVKDNEFGFWAALLGGCFNEETKDLGRKDYRGRADRDARSSRREDPVRRSRHSAPPGVTRKPVAAPPKATPNVGLGGHSVGVPRAMRPQRYERPNISSSKSADELYGKRDSAFENSPIKPLSRAESRVYGDSTGTPREFGNNSLYPPTRESSRLSLPIERRPQPENPRSNSSPSTVPLGLPQAPIFTSEDDKSERDRKVKAYVKLLEGMAKPVTPSDGPGFIYIFWQTDVQQTHAETAAAASLISAPVNRPQRSEEEVLSRRFFQTSANASLPPREKRTIFLKIGRAVNVHQRLNQWENQCGYSISLLRSYPVTANGRLAQMVPNVGKVERLIHLQLEMLGKRVKRRCRCGTLHMEWFEIDATRDAIREVDVLVQEWVQRSQNDDW